jgi:hypothetical protein
VRLAGLTLRNSSATVGQGLLEVGVKRYILFGGALLAGLTLRNNYVFIRTIGSGNSNFAGIAMTFGFITVRTVGSFSLIAGYGSST